MWATKSRTKGKKMSDLRLIQKRVIKRPSERKYYANDSVFWKQLRASNYVVEEFCINILSQKRMIAEGKVSPLRILRENNIMQERERDERRGETAKEEEWSFFV